MRADAPQDPVSHSSSAATSSRMKWLLVVCVFLGLALRAIEAHGKSLWLDELHTLFLADSGSLGEIVDKVRSDFHPPLFFWVLSLLREVDAHSQRCLPILLSMLTLLPLWSIAKQGGLGQLARVSLCGVFLFAPCQIQYGSELRSYSALQLVSVLLVWAALTSRARPRTRILTFGIVTVVGLYLHYFTAVTVVSVGIVRCCMRPHGSLPLKALVLSGTIGVALFLPWILEAESWMVTNPDQILSWKVVPDRAAWHVWLHSLQAGALVPMRMLVPVMAGLGEPSASLIRIAAALLFAAVGVLALSIARRAAQRSMPAGIEVMQAALLVSFVAYAMALALCLILWKRVPLQYFMVASWGWPLFIGMGVHCMRRDRLAKGVAGVVLLAGFVAGLCHAHGASREDIEAGVRAALSVGQGRDAVYSAVLMQPVHYPHVMPWKYSADAATTSGLDVREPYEVPAGNAPGGQRPVIVVTRKSDPEGPRAIKRLWGSILVGRQLVETLEIDSATRVYVFETR
ncbi:MAG: hypothetical protein ACJA0V_000317 [Planctomycetota bacterium]|jgi:hypothetical protein